jgi:hypothetical protein
MFGASFGPVAISVCAKHRRASRVRSVAYAHSRKLHRSVRKVKSWTGFADVDTDIESWRFIYRPVACYSRVSPSERVRDYLSGGS